MTFEGAQPKGITRGQTLHIRLELGNLSTAVLFPQGGFYQRTGGQWVYLVNDAGEFAIIRKINLGRLNGRPMLKMHQIVAIHRDVENTQREIETGNSFNLTM